MNRRAFAESTAYVNNTWESSITGDKIQVIVTLIPNAVFHMLEIKRPAYAYFIKTGKYHQLKLGEKNDKLTRRIMSKRCIQIPDDVISQMNIKNGTKLEWSLGSSPENKWAIYVRPIHGKIDYRTNNHVSSRIRPADSIHNRLPVATTVIHKYRTSKSTQQVTTTIPLPCHRIIGIPRPGYVRWTKSGSFYILEPYAFRIEGTRKIREIRETFKVSMDEDVSGEIYSGKGCMLQWYIASDGYGRWEIHASTNRAGIG